jgi:hypothetical protein
MKTALVNVLLILLEAVFFVPFASHSQGIGINNGGLDPHPSAMLDIEATNKGFLPPRMSTLQRDAISSPAIGLLIYNTITNCLNYYDGIGWREKCGSPTYPLIGSLNCVSATNNGTLTVGIAASSVSSDIPYTSGNGGPYNAQIISSTGVTGLTATLSSGNFANGSGSLNYVISGTPATSGTASFALNVGGQTCNLSVVVNSAGPWPSGYIHCNGIPTIIADVTSPTGKVWMDRNLGANRVATSSTDAQAYGSLFQWGRFADGHQCVNRYSGDGVTTSGLATSSSASDTPGHGDFIPAGSDWRNPQNDSFWQGVNNINNPCPAGYRVPSDAELSDERASWSTKNSAGAFASPLKWTVTGSRQNANGAINFAGGNGNYWSSSTILVCPTCASDSRSLGFGSSFSGIYTSGRAYGLSVRCIKN